MVEGADESEPAVDLVKYQQLVELVLGVFQHPLIVCNWTTRLGGLTLVDEAGWAGIIACLPAHAWASSTACLIHLHVEGLCSLHS